MSQTTKAMGEDWSRYYLKTHLKKEKQSGPQVLTCLPILTKLEDAQPPALGCVLPVCREDLCYAVQRRG